MISTQLVDNEAIDEIKILYVPLVVTTEDEYPEESDKISNFGNGVYNLLKNKNYCRENLTVTEKNIKPENKSLIKIMEKLAEIREEYNGKVTLDNIDDDTEDFSDYGFGLDVLVILKEDGVL